MHAQAFSNRLGLSLRDGRALGPRTQVLKATGLTSSELATRLAADPDIEIAEVDGRKRVLAVPPNDPLYAAGQTAANVPPAGQWYLRAPTSATIVDTTSVLSSINAEPAWAITTGNPNVVVADLDTGVRLDHPDLAPNLLAGGYDFVHDAAISNDGDGRDADPSDPGDFGVSCGGDATSSWHGTQTAGIIAAASNNGVGMASVGRNVKLLPVRVLGCGGGYDSDIQAAMQWAVGLHVDGVPDNTHPAKVLNLSLGAPGTCSAFYQQAFAQVAAAGAVAVVAAGNEGTDLGSPANCPGAIAVAGLRHAGTKVGYSDVGATIAIAAPAGNCVNSNGVCLYPLLSTSNSGTTTPVLGAAGAIYTGSGNDATLGTSFSSPLVAGTAALMFSANPALTPAALLTALKATARPFPTSGAPPVQLVAGGPLVPVAACLAPSSTAQNDECYCTTGTCGAGMLDTGAAVTAVAATRVAAATITVASTSVATGASLALDGTNAVAASGRTITGYLWSISPATGVATLGPNGGPTETLTGVTAGSVVVSLTITDSAGVQTTSSVTVAVSAPVPASSSSGGGGAMDLGWLLGWLASVIGVWAVTPRRRRA